MGFRFRVKNTVEVDEAYVSAGCCGEDAPTGNVVPVLVFGKITEEYATAKHYSYLVVDNAGRSFKVDEDKVSKPAKDDGDDVPEATNEEPSGEVSLDGV